VNEPQQTADSNREQQQGSTGDTSPAEQSLSEKMEEFRENLESISQEAENQQVWPKAQYMQALNSLQDQIAAIQREFEVVSADYRGQRQQLESLLNAFPGTIEMSTLRALSLRVNHLESLVSELFKEKESKESAERARKQMIVSLVALGVTVVLWTVWVVLTVAG